MNLIKGVLFGLAAQIVTFLQLQGSIKYDLFKRNEWLVVLIGAPVTWLYLKSVQYLVLAFNGQIWPSRILGFGLGVTVFTTMSYLLFREAVTFKTFTCLSLGLLIILIQILWKN